MDLLIGMMEIFGVFFCILDLIRVFSFSIYRKYVRTRKFALVKRMVLIHKSGERNMNGTLKIMNSRNCAVTEIKILSGLKNL